VSVYKHDYRAYTGRITPAWSRIFVLARYGFIEACASKITIGLFVLCSFPPLLFLFGIYVMNNPAMRILIGNLGPATMTIDAQYFLHILQIQAWLALVLASWIAPRLITFDLADNALPILLSHPISRFGYVFGKFVALFASLSVVTWFPLLLLFAYQGYASSRPWALGHFHIAIGLFFGSLIWITFLSLLGLAFSAWVKWRVIATGVIFAAVFVPAGVGAIVSAVLHTTLGFLLNFPVIMALLWERLLGAEGMSGLSLPIPAIVAVLILACILCIAMLNARIRAREVIRG
jgi:ABC-type transport system involved in multi-copper enzyme maturation permease subunit